MPRLTFALCLLAGAAAAQDDLRQTYDSRVAGLWQGDGGTCSTQVGTWDFTADGVRGNASQFDLTGIFGTTDRLALALRRPDGTALTLVLRPAGSDALAITAPGIAADVTRCPAEAPQGDSTAATDGATFKPIRMTGVTCGDNCYIDYVEQAEGAAAASALCSAPQCAAWFDAGTIPTALTDGIVGAAFGTGTQVDASGTVMSTDFPEITAFGPPDTPLPGAITVPPAPDRNLDDIVAQLEAAAQAFDAARFKPVRLSGLTCGDTCLLAYAPQLEGTEDGLARCAAPECAAWIAIGTLPEGLTHTVVGAAFADAADAEGHRVITAFGIPDAGQPAQRLPLPPGTYVDTQLGCTDAPNAAIREFTGAGFNGSSTRDCTFYAPAREGDMFQGIQTCTDTYTGTLSTVPLTVTLDGEGGFTLTEGPDDTQSFAFCQGD